MRNLMQRTRTTLIAAALTIVAFASGITPPAFAVAATGGVEVSADGVTFGSAYSGALFDDIALMVPGDSQSTTFYVRNSGTEAGILRIALQDVVSSDTAYADALSVTLSSATTPGTASAISAANPCWVLLEGETVAPGQVVAVSSTAALGNLSGQAGQGATASLALGVGLRSFDAPTPAATSCNGLTTTVAVTPTSNAPAAMPPPRPPAGTGGATVSAVPGAGTAESEPDVDLPVLNLPELFGIDPNTWHLWEELFVVLLVGSSILGGVVFALVARRRRNTADQQEEIA